VFKASAGACAASLALALFDAAMAKEDQPVASPCALTYEAARNRGESSAAHQDHARFTEFAGDEAAVLLEAINNAPPRSHLVADHILVLERPDSDSVKVALVNHDCVTNWTTMSEKDWRKLKVAALSGDL
jgi:hypothetical protein